MSVKKWNLLFQCSGLTFPLLIKSCEAQGSHVTAVGRDLLACFFLTWEAAQATVTEKLQVTAAGHNPGPNQETDQLRESNFGDFSRNLEAVPRLVRPRADQDLEGGQACDLDHSTAGDTAVVQALVQAVQDVARARDLQASAAFLNCCSRKQVLQARVTGEPEEKNCFKENSPSVQVTTKDSCITTSYKFDFFFSRGERQDQISMHQSHKWNYFERLYYPEQEVTVNNIYYTFCHSILHK